MSLPTVRRHSENEPHKGWIESLALAQGTNRLLLPCVP